MKRLWRNILMVLCISPIVYLSVFSISANWIFPVIIPDFEFIAWTDFLIGNNSLLKALLLSVALSTCVGAIATILAFVTSRYLFLSKHSEFWKKLAILPFALSPIVYAIAISFYFRYFGFSASTYGVALAQLLIVYPYAMLLFSGFWNVKHESFQSLVATFGGSTIKQWKLGLFPLSKQILIVCFFQSFLISWFDFGLSQYIGIGKVKTLTIKVYQLVNEGNPYVAAVASMLLIIPPLTLLLLNKTFVIKKI